MIFLKIPLGPMGIVFDPLVENQFWVVDLSRDDEGVDTVVVYSGDALLDCTQINRSLLFNNFGMLSH